MLTRSYQEVRSNAIPCSKYVLRVLPGHFDQLSLVWQSGWWEGCPHAREIPKTSLDDNGGDTR